MQVQSKTGTDHPQVCAGRALVNAKCQNINVAVVRVCGVLSTLVVYFICYKMEGVALFK